MKNTIISTHNFFRRNGTRYVALTFLVILLFSSCKKDKKTIVEEPASPVATEPKPRINFFSGGIGIHSSIMMSDNNLVICGTNNNNFFAMKVSIYGYVYWRKEYKIVSGQIAGVVEIENQELLICGSSSMSSLFVTKLSSYGDSLWTKNYNTPTIGYPTSIIKTSDGNLAISAGWVSYLTLLKLKTNGDTLWTKTYTDPSYYYYIENLIQAQDGGYLMIGGGQDENSSYGKLSIIKTDASGNQLWIKQVGEKEFNGGCDILQLSNGDFLICAQGHVDYTYPLQLTRVNASGDTAWTKHLLTDTYIIPAVIKQNKDGTFTIVGQYNESKLNGTIIIKTDIDGTIIFTKKIVDPGQFFRGSNLVKGKDDENFISGSIYNTNSLFMTATDKDGTYW